MKRLAILTRPGLLAFGLVLGVNFLHAQAPGFFTVVPTPNENFDNGLIAASASSASDIWAVGQSTIHFNGTSWTAFQAPLIRGDNTGTLGGVVNISPTLAWAVGTVTQGPNQVIERWNGTEWTQFPNPSFPPHNTPELFAMTSISANDIWAVGDVNVEGLRIDSLFEHWNGSTWTVVTLNTGGAPILSGASSHAANDVWAVGYNFGGPKTTLAEHWNGQNWSTVATVNVGNGDNLLNNVLALASNNVWAVGASTPEANAPTLTLIEHFDGARWTVVPSPNMGTASNRLFGITAISPTNIYAFGSYFAENGSGNQMTLLLHWNGVNWTVAPSPDPTNRNFLSDILWAGVVPSPGNIWIFGDEDATETLAIHATVGGGS